MPTTSEPSDAGVRQHVTVYLDANLLAAGFVRITENIKDFGADDLQDLSMSAVHPVLFLTAPMSSEEYGFVLDAIAEKLSGDPCLVAHPRRGRIAPPASLSARLTAPALTPNRRPTSTSDRPSCLSSTDTTQKFRGL